MADEEVIELEVIDDSERIAIDVEREKPIAISVKDIVIEREGGGNYQDKTVTPAESEQIIRADTGYSGLDTVTVEAIPSNYGLITWDGTTITVS